VHAYLSLDWDVVHEVATVNLPDMEPRVLGLLRYRTVGRDITALDPTRDTAAPRIPVMRENQEVSART
jgi:hypothetical protein